LAIKGPKGDYLLGIECEGPNYFSGRSAKEREVYRPGLLMRRGWKVYRLWARNYFLNPQQEIKRIVDLLPTASKD
jgi:very-short-patch-repair endonuclease